MHYDGLQGDRYRDFRGCGQHRTFSSKSTVNADRNFTIFLNRVVVASGDPKGCQKFVPISENGKIPEAFPNLLSITPASKTLDATYGESNEVPSRSADAARGYGVTKKTVTFEQDLPRSTIIPRRRVTKRM